MVSYYNPSTVAMFTGTGRGHYHPHHHHSPPSQNPYFPSPPTQYPAAYHHTHSHPNPHPAPHSGSSPLGLGLGLGVNVGGELNCNHPQYSHPHPHHPQFNVSSSLTSAPEPWHQGYAATSACVRGYEDWTGGHAAAAAMHHTQFYHHAQPSPPSSTPSPHLTAPPTSTPHSPYNQQQQQSSSSNANNGTVTPNHTSTPPFKTEFGPCSNNGQDGEMGQGSQVVGGPVTQPAPHSPDSGMAISDGVSSSGSPGTGFGGPAGNGGAASQNPQHCLGGPASSGAGSSASLSSSSSSTSEMHQLQLQGSQYNLNLHHHPGMTSHHSPLINVSNGRPTQARSPYEWMKKPAYSTVPSSSSNNAKTRTKDKYRVVYSDTQRLELEKEFHYSRYITIRRKSELAVNLGLSERQVKIWFQNRRAKERKIHRKRDEMMGRDKLATMVHMQNAMPGMPNSMCNQSIPLM